ncbi:PRP38 family protein [Nitzschia inconspicua]|uniref:Pre-mRNA-splicing factor 38 n=1 Tax=Nitzschia inconspicua TaxID=303405 RepID=A0A9K3KYD8_9STRA|nr:PRP38 family protein [Nitzschia inconspicua]
MANLTDPLIRAIQGSDPQNVMEYIVRQKIYDTRYWKEECFGLSAADVLEKAAELKCVGGSYGANARPTKFLCLTLKLLQLQPDLELIEQFITQDHFKYLKALGAFYLRLTGRPQHIYQQLEPLYENYCKIRYRDVNEWRLLHMDEFIDTLLTKNHACGIAMPRLPSRQLLQQEGYLDDSEDEQDDYNDDDGNNPEKFGRRLSPALRKKVHEAGGIREYLKQRVDEELKTSSGKDNAGNGQAVALWERHFGHVDWQTKPENEPEENEDTREESNNISKKKKRKKDGSSQYGSLFKKSKKQQDPNDAPTVSDVNVNDKKPPEEGSDEYWNEQRALLGLKPLK